MKSRLFWCVLALLALLAVSCGSDSADSASNVDSASTADSATEEGADLADGDDDAEDMADETDGDADNSNDGMADEDAPADDAAAGDDTIADTEAMVDDDEAAADAAAAGDDQPLRIVSLNPTATEMLFAIGAGDQVVAVDNFSYFPAEAPVTDLSGYEPNIEAIAGFEPDLVVTESPLDDLGALDIENVVLPAASTLEDIYAQIEQLGALTGRIGEAGELVLQMQTDIDAAIASVPDRETPLSYYHELDNTLYSVTSGTFVGYVYGLFGLENVADPADEDGSSFGYPQLNEEFLVDADPDLIFLADTLCCEQNAQTVADRPGWDQLTAVQNGNIVELNDDIVSRWGPRIVDFIEAVGAAVSELETAPVG